MEPLAEIGLYPGSAERSLWASSHSKESSWRRVLRQDGLAVKRSRFYTWPYRERKLADFVGVKPPVREGLAGRRPFPSAKTLARRGLAGHFNQKIRDRCSRATSLRSTETPANRSGREGQNKRNYAAFMSIFSWHRPRATPANFAPLTYKLALVFTVE